MAGLSRTAPWPVRCVPPVASTIETAPAGQALGELAGVTGLALLTIDALFQPDSIDRIVLAQV